MYQALYRKWRPRVFDDVVGQQHITDTLKRQVAGGKPSHAYLFTGTRGTGKTTCAKILARAVNCEHPVEGNPCNQCPACRGIEDGSVMEVLELDAASNNGVDQVRTLRDEAVYSPAAVRKRVYIVDEVHMLSNAAFNALLKILEEPPEHLMFILATTELHKVPATIKSRCQQFSFKRISPTDIAGRLKYVAGEEGIPLTAPGAALLSRLADGGMRDALSLLDQCAVGDNARELGEAEILNALGLAGNVETAALLGEIAGRDAGAALERMDRLYAAGKDVGSLLGELSSLTRDLLIRKTAPQGGGALLTGGYDEATLRGLGQMLNASRLAQILSQLQQTAADLGRSANRRVDAELCLIRLCDETLDESIAGLNLRLSRLEEMAAQGTGFAVAQPGRPPATPTRHPAREAASSPSPVRAAPASAPVRAGTPAPAEDPPPWDMAPPAGGAAPGLAAKPTAEEAPSATAPEKDAAPPWDTGASTPAPREEEPQSVPPQTDPAPQAQAPEDAPRKADPAPAGDDIQTMIAPDGYFWQDMVVALKGKVPMGEYSFLSNPKVVGATIDGPILTIWAKDEFTRGMVTRPGVLAAVEKAAGMLPGGPYRVKAAVGPIPTPPPQRRQTKESEEEDDGDVSWGEPAEDDEPAEDADDKLDQLLALGEQLGGIITEEE